MRKARPISGLYAVTPHASDDAQLFSQVEQALMGGVAILQYRDKHSDLTVMRLRARRLRELCQLHDALFIMNDNPGMAAEVCADGVHLGRDDTPVLQARSLLGPNAIIGVSCYDRMQLARDARNQGADYVAFGSVFPSQVKPRAVKASLDLIRQARDELDLPIVAIGGIDLDNAQQVVHAGADALAVISALFGASDIRASARAFTTVFSSVH